jgi:hypothetical protein
MRNSKHAFWQALVFTIVIFGLGFVLGFFLETYRADQVSFDVLNSEIDLLDEQLRNRVIDNFEIDCNIAIENTFEFADSIYYEALSLEKYDEAAKFSKQLKPIHKRYDLLRTMLWTESIDLRERCDREFHTIVYLYAYDSDDLEVEAEQLYLSNILLDLKEKYEKKVLLIPIAANLELSSVDLIKNKYKIEELPAIIIDEEVILYDIESFEELEEKVRS